MSSNAPSLLAQRLVVGIQIGNPSFDSRLTTRSQSLSPTNPGGGHVVDEPSARNRYRVGFRDASTRCGGSWNGLGFALDPVGRRFGLLHGIDQFAAVVMDALNPRRARKCEPLGAQPVDDFIAVREPGRREGRHPSGQITTGLGSKLGHEVTFFAAEVSRHKGLNPRCHSVSVGQHHEPLRDNAFPILVRVAL